MRLISLHPNWYRDVWKTAEGVEMPAGDRHGMGIVFDCPVHGDGCSLGVPFANPLDCLPKASVGSGDNKDSWWQREGDTFDSLTLAPSVHVQDVAADGTKTTHWHGWIRAGEVT